MSKTDITFIDENGDLREKAHLVHGQRVSEPDKLSEQTIIRDETGTEVLARKVDANVEIEDIPGLGDKLDALYRTDAALQEQITENANNIEAEAELRHTQDDALLGEIMAETSARQDADAGIKQNAAAIQQALNVEVVRATDAENTLTANKIDKSVLPDALVKVEVESQKSAVLLKTKSKSTDTGVITTATDALPVANSEHHGVMSKETYAQLQQLDTRTAALEGASKRYPVHLGTGPLTQEQYQQAYELADNAPGKTPPDGATLVNLDNNHAITYFENAGATNEHWIDRGIDTVSVATNLITGIVKGTEDTAGKIFVELDGTMSVNGWDALISTVQTHIDDAVRHITAGERTLWNSKQNALTTEQIAAANSGINATKVAQYDGYAAEKQDTLVAGTNIKTVNGKSLLGSGDIAIAAEATWGNIKGELANQPDLLTALGGKQDKLTAGFGLQINDNIISLISELVFKPGMAMPFAGQTPPDGWLICDGSAISREKYADLFAVVGTLYGTGDGNSTFNIPDLIGRTILGMSADYLGIYTNGILPNIYSETVIQAWKSDMQSWTSGAIRKQPVVKVGLSAGGESFIFTGPADFDANRCSAVYTNNSWFSGLRAIPAACCMTVCIKY